MITIKKKERKKAIENHGSSLACRSLCNNLRERWGRWLDKPTFSLSLSLSLSPSLSLSLSLTVTLKDKLARRGFLAYFPSAIPLNEELS